MLSNAYFLAKFRFDTAENEPANNLQKFCRICQFWGAPRLAHVSQLEQTRPALRRDVNRFLTAAGQDVVPQYWTN